MPRGGGNDDNRADQMNPNNDAYWESPWGYDETQPPDDWGWEEVGATTMMTGTTTTAQTSSIPTTMLTGHRVARSNLVSSSSGRC